jgi:hypothetical protein
VLAFDQMSESFGLVIEAVPFAKHRSSALCGSVPEAIDDGICCVVNEEQQAVEAIRPRDMQKHTTATRMAQDDLPTTKSCSRATRQLLQGETRSAPVRMLEPVAVQGANHLKCAADIDHPR